MLHLRKNNQTKPIGGIPSAYPSSRVTYGNTTVEGELDAINSKLSEKIVVGDLAGSGTVTINNFRDGSIIFVARNGGPRAISMADLTGTLTPMITPSGVNMSLANNVLTITETSGSAVTYTVIRP